jgi:hypothetical protein
VESYLSGGLSFGLVVRRKAEFSLFPNPYEALVRREASYAIE